MATTWDESRRAFEDAAGWFTRMVALVGDRWGDPGLGEWDVRALVGHTSRALLTVEAYLARPASAVAVETAADYYLAARAATGALGADVAQRGRDAGAALGADPVAAVTEIARRVGGILASQDGTALVTTVAGGMRLRDYLPTRTFELVVHTADLAAALGEAASPPPVAAAHALHLAGELAVLEGEAVPVLLALTDRAALPAGFSLL